MGRASSGYIVWIDGVSRFMVDAGGGTFARFHEADAKVSDLDLLALSHFHPDHAAEVPALLWVQTGNLRVAGPSGTPGFPSVADFLSGMFGPEGVFRVIGRLMKFEVTTVDVSNPKPIDVFSAGSIRVRGLGVPHGTVPTVAYRIDFGNTSVAFSSDQNGSNPAFTEFVSGVDVLVVHFAASEEAVGIAAELHAKPSVWGQMATDAAVGMLVLSHLSNAYPSWPGYSSASGSDFKGNLAQLRSRYKGSLIVAEDLMCVPIE